MQFNVRAVVVRADVPSLNGNVYTAKALKALHDGNRLFWDEDKKTLSCVGTISELVHKSRWNTQDIRGTMKDPMFIDISLCDASLAKSRWQVFFMGLQPLENEAYLSLPETHESDKAFFDEHWKGGANFLDIPYTYDTFMLLHYWHQARKIFVQKKSGKPFKSGKKTAVVKRIIVSDLVPSSPGQDGKRVFLSKAAYEFQSEDDGYYVHVRLCKEVAP